MTKGIHHITAIASNAQNTIHFYAKILGLRLVKKTVNQDDVETYHLFFGDAAGHPGLDLTFFIFQPPSPGKRGNGQVTKISLAVPEGSLRYWLKRFNTYSVKNEGLSVRFKKKRIVFYDGDNQRLELVGLSSKELDSDKEIWETKEIKKKNAIRSFYSATLNVENSLLIEPILLHVFGYVHIYTEGNLTLYGIPTSSRANHIEIEEDVNSGYGFNAAGTVHHIAFRAKNEEEQLTLSNKVIELGIQTTQVINRFYFKSVYFRTPSGILFEIATDGPGFTADETKKELGKKLALPPFLESQRKLIEANLPPIFLE